jgi:hypothetical protein
MLSGLREEVVRGATLTAPAGWRCLELDGGAEAFYVGNLGSGRDYWYVYRRVAVGAASSPIRLSTASGTEAEISVIFADEAPEAREQILRCRVARLMSDMSNALEAGGALPREAATALKAEIDGFPVDFRVRPLVLRLQGQIAELLATPEPAPQSSPFLAGVRGLGRSPAVWPAGGGSMRNLAARLASGMTCLTNQRGVFTGMYEGDPNRSISLFSSPSQRSASNQVRAVYSASSGGDPHALPTTPSSSQPEADV